MKKVLISFDLLLDYNNLMFSSLRSFLEQHDQLLPSALRLQVEGVDPLTAFDIIG